VLLPPGVVVVDAAVEGRSPTGVAFVDSDAPAGPAPSVTFDAPDASPVGAVVVASAAGLVLARPASRASFLAQPDPLNTMAGADRARFMAPPHRSQTDGPGAEIAWMTSTTCPQDPQT